MQKTAYRWRGVLAWYAAALACLIGVLLALGNMLWFVSLLLRPLFCEIPGVACEWNHPPGFFIYGGFIMAPLGFILGAVFVGIGTHVLIEQRWRGGLRRGIVTVRDLQPGDTNAAGATQALTCRLEIRGEGMDPTSADYRYHADVGPLDAPRLVDGATFVCEDSSKLPGRVRLWLFADPHADKLAGRYLDFTPAFVQPKRSRGGLAMPIAYWALLTSAQQ